MTFNIGNGILISMLTFQTKQIEFYKKLQINLCWDYNNENIFFLFNAKSTYKEIDPTWEIFNFSCDFSAILVSCPNNAMEVMDMGKIQTPNYPNDYPSSQTCIWMITVPEGSKVLLKFDAFEVIHNFINNIWYLIY